MDINYNYFGVFSIHFINSVSSSVVFVVVEVGASFTIFLK